MLVIFANVSNHSYSVFALIRNLLKLHRVSHYFLQTLSGNGEHKELIYFSFKCFTVSNVEPIAICRRTIIIMAMSYNRLGYMKSRERLLTQTYSFACAPPSARTLAVPFPKYVKGGRRQSSLYATTSLNSN